MTGHWQRVETELLELGVMTGPYQAPFVQMKTEGITLPILVGVSAKFQNGMIAAIGVHLALKPMKSGAQTTYPFEFLVKAAEVEGRDIIFKPQIELPLHGGTIKVEMEVKLNVRVSDLRIEKDEVKCDLMVRTPNGAYTGEIPFDLTKAITIPIPR